MIYSRLEAVNQMLMAAGDFPVNSLASDGVNETTIAETILEDSSIRAQLTGLHSNTRISTYVPDDQGRIILPSNLLAVDSEGTSLGRDVTVVRDGSTIILYDLDKQTSVFTDSIKLKLVLKLEFEDLPSAIQAQVIDSAAREYQIRTLGDPARDRALSENSFLSRARGRAADMRQKDANIFRSQSLTAKQAHRRDQRYLW